MSFRNYSKSFTSCIEGNIPATCYPIIIPPDVWIRNNSLTIKMDCTDPTKSGTDHLKYSLTGGNYTYGFTEKSNSQGTIELRYNLLVSGVFQVIVIHTISVIYYLTL